MNEIGDSERTADPVHRRERGIEAYARIFDVPEKDVPAAMAGRVGPVFAEEVFLAAGGPAWFHPALTDRERSMVIIAALAAARASPVSAWTVTSGWRSHSSDPNFTGQCRWPLQFSIAR
jgi:hypothetical protein